jgi:uncharacterized protein involved in type VI secretion and phage assembly
MMMEYLQSDPLVTFTRSHYFGKHRGIVTDNNDPTHRGRLKVKVRNLLGDLELWAMPCVPYAGKRMGFYNLPEVKTGVWIEFESGNLTYPIWTGCFWEDDQLPENQEGTEASLPLKILRTKAGLLLAFDDDNQTITLSDDQGKNLLTISVPSGQIKIQATAKVVVEAPQIELVENSTHPIVFGDQLLQYLNRLVTLFNSHMHPGELAVGVLPVTPMPPVPPLPPADPSMLSTKVRNG